VAIEIEIKAHIPDPESQKAVFSRLAGDPRSFEKDDCYWAAPEPAAMGEFPKSGVRVRRETSAYPDGRGITKKLVTYKSKEIRSGIEVNREREFTLSDEGEDGDVFEELLIRLGLKPGTRKHKAGWAWAYKGITAELCEVQGFNPGASGNSAGGSAGERNLGWFAELEILAPDDRDETVSAARNRLLELLETAGIPREQIEERYYSEMLL
jgi:adenylate cyclase class 2